MTSLISVIGERPEATLDEYIGWKPVTTVTSFIGERVETIIDELVENINFNKYVESIRKDIQKHPGKYPDLSNKYRKYLK